MADHPTSAYNVKREIQKRADRFSRNLEGSERDVFLQVVENVRSEMVEENVKSELSRYFSRLTHAGKMPNVTILNTNINATFRKVLNWARRNPSASPARIAEFSAQISRAARSFCRIFDPLASCWKPLA